MPQQASYRLLGARPLGSRLLGSRLLGACALGAVGLCLLLGVVCGRVDAAPSAGRAPVETSQGASVETSQGASVETSQGAPVETSLGASAETSQATLLASASYPEGPLWQGGRLLYVEYGGHRVMEIPAGGGGARQLWARAGSGPAALAPAAGGGLWMACYDSNQLVRLDPTGRQVSAIGSDEAGKALEGPNDICPDGKGGLYFTTSGVFELAAPVAGKVFHMEAMRPAGWRIHEVAHGIRYANGLALVDGGRGLLVNEHLERRVLHFEVGPDGRLSGRKVHADLKALFAGATDPLAGCDGMKVDAAGRAYVCLYGAGRVAVLDPAGRPLRTLALPYPYVTNVALGGGQETMAYVTASLDTRHPPYPGGVFALPIAPF